jgi:hypothetical protein
MGRKPPPLILWHQSACLSAGNIMEHEGVSIANLPFWVIKVSWSLMHVFSELLTE